LTLGHGAPNRSAPRLRQAGSPLRRPLPPAIARTCRGIVPSAMPVWPLAERDDEPVDLRVAQAQDQRAGSGGRLGLPGVVGDDEVVSRLAGAQDHDLVVRRLVDVRACDRGLAAERAERDTLECE